MKVSTSWLAFAALISPFVRSHPLSEDGYLARRDDDFYLRIMPLGASITYGIQSTDGNGYRKALRDQLRYDGWRVNMVGSLFSGTMNDSDTEGWSGYRVDQVLDRAKAAVPRMKPNLVLINAGTNDAGQNYQVDTVGKRMRGLIEYLLSDDADRVVILSTLVASRDNQPRTDKINAQYRDLAKALRSEAKHVVLADFATDFITLKDISSDGIHPTDAGYRKLAAVWHNSILEVNKLGWLKPPKSAFYADDDAGSTTCEKTLWSGVSRGSKEVLRGAAAVFKNDGAYVHKSESKGVIAKGEGEDVWFAEVVSDGDGSVSDELLWMEKGAVWMRVNEGNGTFGDAVEIDTKSDCDAEGIRWGDVNNDGLDDFICISEAGDMNVSINRGGNPPEFEDLGSYTTAPSGGEYNRSSVRLGDIDGDGRLDYCVVSSKGDVTCWRNAGQGDKADFWQDLGSGKPVFTDYGWDEKTEILNTGVGRRALRFADMDGDGKCDVVAVDKETGALDVWYTSYDKSAKKFTFSSKTRVEGSGTEKGPSCDQGWGVGITDLGLRLADIDGDGRADYLCIKPNGDITASLNTATGFTQPDLTFPSALDRADMRFADVNGDGLADLLVVDEFTGDTSVWLNKNPVWEEQGVLYQGSGRGENVHFANLGGQGRADLVNLEPKTDKATAWYNPCPRGGDDGEVVDPELPEVTDS